MTIEHRAMTQDELAGVLDWAAAEGWNPGLEDAAAFFAADPAGFFVATNATQAVAAISVVNHSDDFAFLGLYLCRPEYRGQGIGLALWQHALAHAGGRTVGLDGVADQQANYEKSGFVHAGGTTRFSGKLQGVLYGGVRAAREEDIDELVDREADACGWRKPAYLSAWFRNNAQRKTYLYDAKGETEGFATVRQCREGAKIGPLVAPDEEVAYALLLHCAAAFGEDIVIDVPATSTRLRGMVEELGLSPGFETARMYKGEARTPRSELYAVTSLELG
ncbi:MAG: GNAT family N-acetyltransferase [Pseudomonadota bacterium]